MYLAKSEEDTNNSVISNQSNSNYIQFRLVVFKNAANKKIPYWTF